MTRILRLSTKYLIDRIRASALEALGEAYQDSLDKWEGYRGTRELDDLVVKLAHEVNADILLPGAYHELCSYVIKDVFKWRLPQPMLERYIQGKERLCMRNWGLLESKTLRFLRRPICIALPNPLLDLSLLLTFKCVSELCPQCREELQTVIREEREKVWSVLPATFDLGSWEELWKKRDNW